MKNALTREKPLLHNNHMDFPRHRNSFRTKQTPRERLVFYFRYKDFGPAVRVVLVTIAVVAAITLFAVLFSGAFDRGWF